MVGGGGGGGGVAGVRILIKSIRCRILRLYILKFRYENHDIWKKLGGGGGGVSSDPYH